MMHAQATRVVADDRQSTSTMNTLGTASMAIAPLVDTGTRYGRGMPGLEMRSLTNAANSSSAAKQ